MNKNQFLTALQELNIELEPNQQHQLEKFYHLLRTWNEKMNLTRIIKVEDVYLKHFYDSLTLVKSIDLKQIHSVCDVGSGAGFPGIVLKIVFPHLKIVLIDKLLKRVNYLNDVIKKLNLSDIKAVHVRAEDYKEEQFDLVTARAVANLDTLCTYCLPLVKSNGVFVAMKGHLDEELKDKFALSQKHHCEVQNIVSFLLPYENSIRNLIVIKKIERNEKKCYNDIIGN